MSTILDGFNLFPDSRGLGQPSGQSMTTRHLCPCCSNTLLRHLDHGELYWRCSHCWQTMPVEEDCTNLA